MRIITLEDHFATPMFNSVRPTMPGFEFILSSRGKYLGHDIEAELLDLADSRIKAMDAAGVDLQVVSLSAPGCEALDPENAMVVARDANERLSAAVQAHPDRLAGFAALPVASPSEAVKELERTVKRLGFKGAMLNGHARGAYLDDRKFWGIFECAEALGVPLYIHPTAPHPAVMKAYFEGFDELALAAWGFAAETCTHFLRLLFSGLFDEFPKLKIILGHLGEGLPFWLHRLNDHTFMAARRRGLKRTPAEYLVENLMVTTSGNFYTPAFLCTLMALGLDNVLFSVDWPYEANRTAVDWLTSLPISERDKERIAHINAERVLGL